MHKETNAAQDCQSIGRDVLGSNVTSQLANGATGVSKSLARRVIFLVPSGSVAIVSGNTL